jgi:hypothetical protein
MPPRKRFPIGAQPLHEKVEVGEVVGIVAVAHDDVAPARRFDAGDQRGAIAAVLHVNDARVARAGDLLAAVG